MSGKQQVTDHLGQPRSAEMRFVANPSPDIGRVISAESTLKKGKKPGLMSPGDACTFVGEDGLHQIWLKGRAEEVKRDEVLRFAEAHDLRTRVEVTVQSGFYQHTGFGFVWLDAERKPRFQNEYLFHDKAVYKGEASVPTGMDLGASLYRFGLAGERVWTRLCLARATESFQRDGFVEFRLTAKEWIKLGQGFLEISLGRTERRFEREELGRVQLQEGRWWITPAGAKKGLLGTKGEITFWARNLANARVFVVCLQKLLGITPC